MWKRLTVVFCVICVAFMALSMRLGYVAADGFYLETAARQSGYTLTHQIKRGDIFDTNGEPLVNRNTVSMASILVTQQNAALVAELTGLSPGEVEEHLRDGKPFLYEVNVQQCDDPDILVFPTYQRYGRNQAAQHLLGYLGEEGGVTGLERSYDTILEEGTQSVSITYTLDALRRNITGSKPSAKTDRGSEAGLVLTIDREIQEICEQAGRDIRRGAIVVMETGTGKLRAVCSFPSYSVYTLADDLTNEDSPMLNRAFTPLNVGSTFKIAMAAAALEQGLPADLTYECEGFYTLADVKIGCIRKSGHGVLDMEEALGFSCNPWFIDIGLRLDSQALFSMLTSMSFGKQYELAPGLYTQAGMMPSPDQLTRGQIANLSFGQGDLMATPVQIAQMVSCIAGHGVTPTPSLVEGVMNADGSWAEQYDTPLGISAIDPSTAYRLQGYLISAVKAEGQNANPSYVSAGGKTSTAQTGIFQDGEEVLYGWFAGFVPAETPKYAVVVITEDAQSGNQDASPVFASIADKLYLRGKLS